MRPDRRAIRLLANKKEIAHARLTMEAIVAVQENASTGLTPALVAAVESYQAAYMDWERAAHPGGVQ